MGKSRSSRGFGSNYRPCLLTWTDDAPLTIIVSRYGQGCRLIMGTCRFQIVPWSRSRPNYTYIFLMLSISGKIRIKIINELESSHYIHSHSHTTTSFTTWKVPNLKSLQIYSDVSNRAGGSCSIEHDHSNSCKTYSYDLTTYSPLTQPLFARRVTTHPPPTQ